MDWALNRGKYCHQDRYSAYLHGGFILAGKTDFKLIMAKGDMETWNRIIWGGGQEKHPKRDKYLNLKDELYIARQGFGVWSRNGEEI